MNKLNNDIEYFQKVISKISQFYNSELLSKEESLKKITIENENCINIEKKLVSFSKFCESKLFTFS